MVLCGAQPLGSLLAGWAADAWGVPVVLAGQAAGIELSRRMVDGERSAEVVREKLRTYREEKGKRLASAEADAIEIVLNPAARFAGSC